MKSKAGVILFALVFALGFGAGGAFGLWSLGKQIVGWWDARSWQPLAAHVLEAELRTSHGDSTTYEALGLYRYVVAGREYQSRRIGFSRGSDNVGDWQQEQYRTS